MKRILMTSVAAIALLATPAYAQISTSAQTNDEAVVGGTAGGLTGGALGFLVGGPVGAIVGGFAGAVLGAEANVPDETVAYVGNNPVDPVTLDGRIEIGSTLPADVKVYPVKPTPEYGYVYANDRVYIVDNNSHKIVYSPGYAIPQAAVTFAENNPTTSVDVNGSLEPGLTLNGSVKVAAIPNHPGYGYIYVDNKPALVDTRSNIVIWVG